MLHNGLQAPDFTLAQVDGPELSLSATLREGQHVLLIFMRYLG